MLDTQVFLLVFGHGQSPSIKRCSLLAASLPYAKILAMLTKGLATRIAERLETVPPQRRHAVIDDLLPDDLAHAIGAAYPDDGKGFTRLKSFRESKLTSNRFDILPPILGEIAFALQAPEVIAQVKRITGMSALIPDPTSYAGGVSIMGKGDFLNPHIDNSHNGSRALYRRLNLLYYPNPDWREGDGGEFELWDEAVTHQRRIPPRFNRLVLMETNRTSWHSVAPIVRGPRRCVSSYYFSKGSPDGSDYYHVTSFTGRPGQHFRRGIGIFDNAARGLVRKLGARRAADAGHAYETSA